MRTLKFCIIFFSCLWSCSTGQKNNLITIGYLDLLEDETLAQARKGFFVALKENGFSDKEGTLKIIYRNAHGDQPTLLQACDYIISQSPDLIATNPTLPTIVAVQKTKTIPLFMMVSPRPDIAGLTDKAGKSPSNLFGVYETLEYIDTSVMLIHSVLPSVKKLGAIYNQAEPQSVMALKKIEATCASLGIEIISQPLNNSSETQLVIEALLNKNIDVFFALPDNVVFASFEVIAKSCGDKNIPIFTSEEGLVKRGALAAFGADMYQWGYQSGMQAAQFLKTKSLDGLKPEIVKVRRKVYNAEQAKLFHLNFDSTFTEVK
ncbi:MAG TPA: ABC transporter substrate-binding protein [Bacteroidia bacterium]|nr:ABC transporter substrate-binding protein [Bacteroidia bacterium]